MRASRAAYRYALSLFEVAQETRALDAVSDDCRMIEDVIGASRELQHFLQSPVVKTAKKRTVMNELFGGKVNPLTQRFLLLLTAKNREGMLREVVTQFYRIRDAALGILEVKVHSAVALSPAQEKALAARVEAATKKRVRMTVRLEPGLRGGFTIQYDDTVWDASVRRQLESLREQFLGARNHERTNGAAA